MTALALGGLLLGGCHYTRERFRDLSDIIDTKGGSSPRLGLGVKGEATNFIWGGLGYGQPGPEYYGRRIFNKHLAGTTGKDGFRGPEEVGLGIGHFQLRDITKSGLWDNMATSYFGINPFAYNAIVSEDEWQATAVPWRVGLEVWLPFYDVGIYLNVGELIDFLVGFVGLDPADDEDIPIGSPHNYEREDTGES